MVASTEKDWGMSIGVGAMHEPSQCAGRSTDCKVPPQEASVVLAASPSGN